MNLLLGKISKWASIAVASKTSAKVIPSICTFSDFLQLQIC